MVRDLGDLDNTLSVTNQWPHLLGRQILLLPSTTNSPNKTLPQWKMPTDSCSSISHIQTWLLQHHSDQPTRQHTSSIHHYPPQCCTFRQMIEAKRSHHPSSLATPLASHPSANFIQNLCPYFQHPFRVISALHVILGHAVQKSNRDRVSARLPKATT